ncbi:metallophosphoesterase [Hazenella sp. IB182357]|uniref:Phosphoesterase n=1 Tax=Polycladospora coralii TaxID=2771432 RepID=A0A926RU11_9BACL|nr:metallophosphoesterase [Polycladospora coralii]MBD1371819.1 metallophosphoesterase [Polycladospora coralii]MBS7529280.1 metallophosphoesterase [Polycladospora coralii]
MRILVLSDSHGQRDQVLKIMENVGADHVIHCGDVCTDGEEFEDTPITVVKGNCDWSPFPEETIWEAEPLRILVTHGHDYQVKRTPIPLSYRCEEVGAQIACFGHSHFPFCEKIGDVLLINPGSISKPRGFSHSTYVVLNVNGNQAQVDYFGLDHRPFPDLNRSVSLLLDRNLKL